MGMLMGPVLSSMVFPLFAYAGTFIFYGCTIGIFGCGSCYMLPARLNHSTRAANLDIHSQAAVDAARDGGAAVQTGTDEMIDDLNKIKETVPVTYKMFFANKRSALSLFTLVYAQFCMNYMIPTLSI